jgi:hypothetical protein
MDGWKSFFLQRVIHPCLNDSSDHDITFYYLVDDTCVCRCTLFRGKGHGLSICLSLPGILCEARKLRWLQKPRISGSAAS